MDRTVGVGFRRRRIRHADRRGRGLSAGADPADALSQGFRHNDHGDLDGHGVGQRRLGHRRLFPHETGPLSRGHPVRPGHRARAIVGAKIVDCIPQRIFAVIMSVFLLAIAAMLVLRPRESKLLGRGNGEAEGLLPGVKSPPPDFPFNAKLGVSLSLAVGMIASMLGVGGGIIHVQALVSLLGFPVHVATATSHFVLVFTSLDGDADASVRRHARGARPGQSRAPAGRRRHSRGATGRDAGQENQRPLDSPRLGIALILVAARLLMTKA